MKADEARDITRKNLQGPVIEPILASIYERIKGAALQGRSSIMNPFTNFKKHPTPAEERAVFMRLRQDGFEVIRHDDPDPGHPCSRPFTEIRW